MAARVSPEEAAAILDYLRTHRQDQTAAHFGRAPATIRLVQRGLHAAQRGRNLYPPNRSGDDLARAADQPPPDGLFAEPAARCPGCGGKVAMPCRVCATRATVALLKLRNRIATGQAEPVGLHLRPDHRERYQEIRRRRQARDEVTGPPAAGDPTPAPAPWPWAEHGRLLLRCFAF